MRSLLSRSPALRRLPVWLLIVVVTIQLIYGLAAYWTAQGGASWRLLLLAGSWMLLTDFLALGPVRQRAAAFDLALPIPARRLWTASLLGSCLAGLAVLAVMVVLLVLIQLLIGAKGTLGMFTLRDVAVVALLLAAALLPATVWAHGRRPDLATAPRGWRHFLHVWLLNLPLGGLLLLMREAPAMFVPICLVLGLALWRHDLRRMPAVFSLAPRDSAPAGATARPCAVRARPTRGWRQLAAIYVTAYRTAPRGLALVFVSGPFLLLFGLLLSGGLLALAPDFEFRFTLLPMGVYMVLTTVAPLLQNLRPFDALPLSRRRLFTLFTLPALLVGALGYLGGRLLADTRPVVAPAVAYTTAERSGGLQVSPTLWRLSLDGEVPDQIDPAGETHAPTRLRVLPGLPAVLWKPYTAPTEASQSYVEWQYARALSDIYVVEIRRDEVADRYFRTDDEGRVRTVASKLDFAADHPELRPAARGDHAPGILLVTGCLSYLCLAWFAPRIRAGVSKRRRTALLWIPLGLLLALHMGLFLAPLWLGTDLWVFDAVLAALVGGLVAAVPGGTPGAWILCLVAVWGSFELALRGFEKTESPVESDSCLWNTVMKGD